MKQPSRRDFLKLATNTLLTLSGLIGLGGLLRFLTYQTESPSVDEFDLGPAANYPPGSRTVLDHPPALLLRTDAGFQALSLVCPHLGCTVEPGPDGFRCPCHGSRFAADGSLVNGPASRPLSPLRVEVRADGHVWAITD